MTEQAQLTTNTPPPIRGGPFTINLLNTILAFAASDERDVFLCYTLVCKQWREAELFYCQEMWRNISQKKFGTIMKGFRWSHWSFLKRALAFKGALGFPREMKLLGDNGNFHEIENCTGEDFAFRCPLIARNMKVLENEVVPGTQRNVLFCDVCNQRVYPLAPGDDTKKIMSVLDAQEKGPSAQGANNEDPEKNDSSSSSKLGGRRCVLIDKRTHDDVLRYQIDPEKYPYKNWEGKAGVFNVAIGTSDPCVEGFNSGYDNDESAATVPSNLYSTNKAEQVLELLARKMIQKLIPQQTCTSRIGFLSKEIFSTVYGWNQVPVRLRIVRVPPAPADLNPDTFLSKYSKQRQASSPSESSGNNSDSFGLHPLYPDGALGKNTMPTQSGWNFIVVVDAKAKPWFEKGNYPAYGSPLGALMATKRVVGFPPFDLDRAMEQQDNQLVSDQFNTAVPSIRGTARFHLAIDPFEMMNNFPPILDDLKQRVDVMRQHVREVRREVFWNSKNKNGEQHKKKEKEENDEEFPPKSSDDAKKLSSPPAAATGGQENKNENPAEWFDSMFSEKPVPISTVAVAPPSLRKKKAKDQQGESGEVAKQNQEYLRDPFAISAKTETITPEDEKAFHRRALADIFAEKVVEMITGKIDEHAEYPMMGDVMF